MGARVLVCDDNLLSASRILSALGKAGYDAERASNVNDAERRVFESPPDALIISFSTGGAEAISRLKRAGAPRILAFHSHVSIPEVRKETLAAGADMLVPNSSVASRLPALMERLLNGSAESQEDGAE